MNEKMMQGKRGETEPANKYILAMIIALIVIMFIILFIILPFSETAKTALSNIKEFFYG